MLGCNCKPYMPSSLLNKSPPWNALHVHCKLISFWDRVQNDSFFISIFQFSVQVLSHKSCFNHPSFTNFQIEICLWNTFVKWKNQKHFQTGVYNTHISSVCLQLYVTLFLPIQHRILKRDHMFLLFSLIYQKNNRLLHVYFMWMYF